MNYAVIIEALIATSAIYISAYVISLIYLLSIGRKMVKREFRLRRGFSMLLAVSILSFLYSGMRFIVLSDSTILLDYIPIIGVFSFVGVGCARLCIDKYQELQTMLKPMQQAQQKTPSNASEQDTDDDEDDMLKPSNLTQPLASSKK